MPAYPKEFKSYISNLVKFLRRVMYHGEYDFTLEYLMDEIESNNDTEIYMRIWVDEVYLNFQIQVSPLMFDLWEEEDYKRIGNLMCHEMSHLITAPLQQVMMNDAAPAQERPYRSVVERQTQRIGNILRLLLPKRWYLPENLEKALA